MLKFHAYVRDDAGSWKVIGDNPKTNPYDQYLTKQINETMILVLWFSDAVSTDLAATLADSFATDNTE